MAVKVQLNDGVELRVHVSLDQMEAAYEAAIANNKLLQVESAGGTTRAVNPHQILYFEEEMASPSAANGAASGSGSSTDAGTSDRASEPIAGAR